jgi:hypothetical protein
VYEHRHPVRTQASVNVGFSGRSGWLLGDGDLGAGLDPREELVMAGGVVE